jgi:methyl-accepting chemotaxis protein
MLKAISSMGLTTRIVIATVVVMVVAVSVNYAKFLTAYSDDARDAMIERAAAFTAVADEAKNHTSDMIASGAIDMAALAKEAEQDLKAGKKIQDLKLFKAIPVVSGWTAARKAAEREQLQFHTPAFNARNQANEPPAGGFRASLLSDLEQQVKGKGADWIARVDQQSNTLHYMRAIMLGESCMRCHGDPAIYGRPDGNGGRLSTDVLGYRMEGWKVGDMHGAYEVVVPLTKVDAQVAGFLEQGLLITGVVMAVSVGGLIFLLRGLLGRPLAVLLDRVRDIATGEGDLTKRVDIKRADEIGQLAGYTDQFIGKVHDIMAVVSGAACEVAAAATEVAASSEQIAKNMSAQAEQVTQAAAAVEEMSHSATGVTQRSEQAVEKADAAGRSATEGDGAVSRTVDDMNAISQVVETSAQIVTELGRRGEQIGQVIAVINDIADQTNLLALNAAIEAARAGEHGRGFAVVADEVRKLAERTTISTREIVESITAIRNETGKAVSQIRGGVDQVRSGVETARSAGAEIRKIVSSSGEVATLIRSIAASAGEQSTAAEEAARGIERVRTAAEEASAAAGQAAAASSQLSVKSEQLETLVRRFKLDRREKDLGPPGGTPDRRARRPAAHAAGQQAPAALTARG